MTSALIVFASTFLTVFALGLQSLNVNQGHYFAAALTSAAISIGHLWLYKVMPNPSWLDLGGYFVGGIVGITTSMWFHRVAKAWWTARKATLHHRVPGQRPPKAPPPRPARRDEHADVDQCQLGQPPRIP